MTSADVPVIEPGEADRWVPPTVSGGPGSLVPWAGLGRDGRLHALASVRPQPLPARPAGVPDLSIETVMGEPARAAPVQVYVGLDSAPTPARAGRPGAGRAGADRRLRPVAARARLADRHRLRQLRRDRRAAVPRARRRRHGDPAVLAAPLAAVARHGPRRPGAEPAAVAADPRAPPRPARARARASCCSARASARTPARTSSCTGARWASTRWASTGRCGSARPTAAGGCARSPAPTASTSTADAVAVVNDRAQLAELAEQRGARPRYVLLSHDNDGVTKFGPDLLWYPPDWLGPDRPRPEPVDGGSPRGIPPAMRWRPVTTFFQSLVDMKNAQTPGPTGPGRTTTARTCRASSARCTTCRVPSSSPDRGDAASCASPSASSSSPRPAVG